MCVDDGKPAGQYSKCVRHNKVIYCNNLTERMKVVQQLQIENNTPCVYAIDFRRSTMLAYIYDGHSIAYDPIYDS